MTADQGRALAIGGTPPPLGTIGRVVVRIADGEASQAATGDDQTTKTAPNAPLKKKRRFSMAGLMVVGVIILLIIIGGQQNDNETAVPATEYEIIPSRANCRDVPSTAGAVVRSLGAGEQVAVEASEAGWSRIEGPSPCWVRDDLLREAMP